MPDGLDLFSWSLPFLAEKITSMLYSILRQCNDAELKGIDEEEEETQKVLQDESSKEAAKLKRKLVLKNKISSVGKMAKMLSNLRENQEEMLVLKQMSPDGRLPRGVLLEKMPKISHTSKSFAITKELDRENEKMPKKKRK